MGLPAKRWQLQEAKNRLSELVDEALRSGPQVITRRGKEAVVVLSCEHYGRLAEPPGRLIDLLRRAPRVRGGIASRRDRDTGRAVKL
jgi:prevent-host-death family protein